MIWFNLKQLEQQISNNELTEKDGYHYLLAYSLLIVLFTSFSQGNSNGWYSAWGCIIQGVLTLWSLSTVYRINESLDGKDFLKRYFAINWVIGMRMFVIVFALTFIFAIMLGISYGLSGQSFNYDGPLFEITSLIIAALITIICCLFMFSSFRNLKVK